MPAAPETKVADKPAAAAPETKLPEKPIDSKAADSFISSLLGKPKPTPEKIEDKADEKPADVKKDDKTEKGKRDVKPSKKTAAREIDPETLVSAAAEGAARALAERDKPKDEPVAEVKPETLFGETEARRIRVLQQMEKNKPEAYKGLSDKYTKSLKALVDYADDWEKKNPGKKFEEDDEAHADFFKNNEVPWEDDDYTEALTDIKADERIGSQKKEIDEKFDEIKREKRYNEAKPAIRGQMVKNARSFYAELGDEYKDLLGENGTPNNEVLAALNKQSPTLTRIAINGADTVETFTHHIEALFESLLPFDANNPVHSTINNFILSKEEQLMKKDKADQRNNDGKPFLPAAEYWKLSPEKRKSYWTFNARDVQGLIRNAVVKHTKDQIAAKEHEISEEMKARGIELPVKKRADEKPIAIEKKAKVEEEHEENSNGKPRSPSAGFQSPSADRAAKDALDPNKPAPVDKFVGKFLGR